MSAENENRRPALETVNPDAMAAFVQRAPEGPVVMLNLLKYKPDGGREMYMRYGAAVFPILEKIGARVLYAGDAAELMIGSEEWDSILLVEYPARQALLDMVTSAEYQAIQSLRDDSLVRSVLYATDPTTIGASG